MIDVFEIGIDMVWEELRGSSLFTNILYDGFTEDDLYTHFTESRVFAAHNGCDFIGLFTLSDVGNNCVESHAYILGEYRKYSIKALKRMIDEIFEMGYDRILTTVTDDYRYIVRFLKLTGFKLDSVLEDFIEKGGKPLDVFFLSRGKC